MSHYDEIDRLRRIHEDNQSSLSQVWGKYAQCNDKLLIMRGREQGYMDTINRLRDEKDAHVETIQQCYDNMENNTADIEQLNQNVSDLKLQILTQRRQYDELRCQREVYEQTVSSLFQTVESLRLANQRLTEENQDLVRACDNLRDQKEAYAGRVMTLSHVGNVLREENNHGQHVQSDYIAAICQLSTQLHDALGRADAVAAQGVEYLYDDEHFNEAIDAVSWEEVHPALKNDIDRALGSLHGTALTTTTAGSAILVSVEWEPPVDADDNDAVSTPICLRIELNATLYMDAPTPPKLKLTKNGEEFPLGHRLTHMLKQYLQRHWSAQGGFSPPLLPPPTDASVREFEYDTDPRCVVPYVADEGRLIAHLVRYAMLRMETYADFCVVCDRPIVDSRDVICGRDLCDYSFHEVGVGYGAVGLERTVATAPELRVRVVVQTHAFTFGEPITVLMMTHVLQYMPTARSHSLVCSSGSLGYCAVKEMLQNGSIGNTLLIESGDLRHVSSMPDGEHGVEQHTRFSLITRDKSGSDDSDKEEDDNDNEASNEEEEATRENSDASSSSSSSEGGNCKSTISVSKGATSVTVLVNSGRLPDRLLKGHRSIKNVDFAYTTHVTLIQHSFFKGCCALESIDLSPLSNVVEVGNAFLMGCSGLTALDLSPLDQLRVVPWGFLEGCSGLKTLDLSGLSQITEVESTFLKGCTGLTAIDLSPLSQVTVLGDFFLSDCTGLTYLNMSPLSKLKAISTNFLDGCTGLSNIKLSGLSQVTEVQWGFLENCSSLKAVDLSLLSSLETAPMGLLQGCSGLTELDLSPLSKVTSLNMGFLQRCVGLTTLNLSPLSQVTVLMMHFLRGCTGLTSLDLSPLTLLTKIFGQFLSDCPAISVIDNLPPLCDTPKGWLAANNKWIRD